MQRTFQVKAIWDEEDQIWVSESDIKGLHIEADTYPEFVDLVNEFASELIATNHLDAADFEGKSPRDFLRDVMPAVILTKGDVPGHAA